MTNTQPLAENIKERMSSSQDLESTQTSYRYVICSSPRSGSNYLCSILKSSGLAGHPLEYFNPQYIAANPSNAGKSAISINTYISELEKRRTSSNGTFGIKIQFWQLRNFFNKKPEPAINFLRQQNQLIYLYRENKLEQAISLYIARNTGAYTSADTRNLKPITFNGAALTECLNLVIQDDVGWKSFLDKNSFPYLSLSYEDLVENTKAEIEKIWGAFGITNAPQIIEKNLTQKLEHPQYQDLLNQFKNFLGL